FNNDFGFEDYVEWALDVPMYFVVRDGKYHDCTHVTFRQFMNGALKGEIADWQPTMGDWTNHLSTLFPDVRLKRFLEMRGADGGPWRRICALPAFWVGLLYDDAALAAAEELTAGWSFEDVLQLRDAVPAKALKAEVAGRPLLEVAKAVVEISRSGLAARKRLNSEGQDETVFLTTLDEVLAKKATMADDLLMLYRGRWQQSVEPIFDEFKY
ncbi:MAG TPA: glutamate-cysteine ligase family protein, partial [Pseudorhizobium sp.]|nr:glutamate-cysteine ligase family protein [Pseudorhizobium sp.]